MPVYKPKTEYLIEALESLFAQTERDWECIIHNQPWDGDVKGSIAEYLKDPRVKFIQGTELRTIGENWNACLPFATSPYLAYLFYDDLWEPAYLKTLCDILDANPSVGFASANKGYFFMNKSNHIPIYDEVANEVATLRPGVHEGKTFLLNWMMRGLRPNVIGEPSFVVMRKKTADAAGSFHATMAQFLDAEYWTRCLAVSDWYFEPTILGRFRVHDMGTSALNAASKKGIYDRLEAMENVVLLLGPEHRSATRGAIRHTLAGMIRTYMNRWKKARGGVKTQGGGGSAAVKKFAMRHPIIMAGAMMEAMFGKAKA